MLESRQLSALKTKHMTMLTALTFLVYSTTSTVVFQVSRYPQCAMLPLLEKLCWDLGRL